MPNPESPTVHLPQPSRTTRKQFLLIYLATVAAAILLTVAVLALASRPRTAAPTKSKPATTKTTEQPEAITPKNLEDKPTATVTSTPTRDQRQALIKALDLPERACNTVNAQLPPNYLCADWADSFQNFKLRFATLDNSSFQRLTPNTWESNQDGYLTNQVLSQTNGSTYEVLYLEGSSAIAVGTLKQPNTTATNEQPTTPARQSLASPLDFQRELRLLADNRMNGQDVQQVQVRILALAGEDPSKGGDGWYGPNTRQSVMEFQTWNNLPVTGEVDRRTWEIMFSQEAQGYPFQRELYLKESDRFNGDDVRRLQNRLMVVANIDLGKGGDGWYGTVTEREVIAFQNRNNLPADGIVDQQTWTLLFSGRAR